MIRGKYLGLGILIILISIFVYAQSFPSGLHEEEVGVYNGKWDCDGHDDRVTWACFKKVSVYVVDVSDSCPEGSHEEEIGVYNGKWDCDGHDDRVTWACFKKVKACLIDSEEYPEDSFTEVGVYNGKWDCDGHDDRVTWACFKKVSVLTGNPFPCTDNDEDGFYAEEGCNTEIDCNDNDAEINPGAFEICNDLIDNDCDGLIDEEDEDCFECTENSDCEVDYCDEWESNYCLLGDTYHERICHEFSCIDNECEENIFDDVELVDDCIEGEFCSQGECLPEPQECTIDSDCGVDYCDEWESNYCLLGDVYHSRTCHDKGCLLGSCFDNTNTEELKVTECGLAGCSDSSCEEEITCYKNLDCGEDECIGNFCFNNTTIYQHKKNWLCILPGSVNSYCVENPYDVFWKNCDVGEICSNGVCVEEPEPTECVINEDCDEDYYSDDYCSLGDVYRDLHDFSCVDDLCAENVSKELIEECDEDEICESGQCVDEEEDDDDNGNGGGGKRSTYSRINYCGDGICDKELGEDEFTCFEDCKIQPLIFRTVEPVEEAVDLKGKFIEEKGAKVFLLFLLLILLLLLLIIIIYFARR